MLTYELYNPLTKQTIGYFKSEELCHVKAKGLSKYEIITCMWTLQSITRLTTKVYEHK
jgi:hypothetical protein